MCWKLGFNELDNTYNGLKMVRKQRQTRFMQRNSSLAKSENSNFWIYFLLDLITIIVLNATIFFLQIFTPPLVMRSFSFILHCLASSQLSIYRSSCLSLSLSYQHLLLEVFGVAVKLNINVQVSSLH